MSITFAKIEHALRAAGEVTGEKRFVLVGSSAVIAWHRSLPFRMVLSREVDLFAFETERADEIAEEIDGSLGQASDFDATHGFYVDGVSPTTALLPIDWRDRCREWSSPGTGGVVAVIPEPNDIALSKLCAWREKDIDWLQVGLRNRILSLPVMRERAPKLPPAAPSPDILETRFTILQRS